MEQSYSAAIRANFPNAKVALLSFIFLKNKHINKIKQILAPASWGWCEYLLNIFIIFLL